MDDLLAKVNEMIRKYGENHEDIKIDQLPSGIIELVDSEDEPSIFGYDRKRDKITWNPTLMQVFSEDIGNRF